MYPMTDSASSPPHGRGGGTTDRPPLTDLRPINPDKASFVTLRAKGQTRLSNVNSFIIKKVIDGNVGNVVNVKKLASGDLLVQALNSAQIKSLLKLRCIHDIEIEASIPVSMNSCRGVVTHADFIDMETAEIVDEMAYQNVIGAKKITKFIDGNRRNTASVILTFSSTKLPDKVEVGYEKIYVRPYIPNPLRCFKCQLYGHHGNACRSSLPYCAKCASEGHTMEQCTSQVEKCRNCGEAHSTFSRDCPAWKLEKEICTVKATEGISYGEARKRVKVAQAAPASNVSYASSVKSRPVMCSVAIQTESTSTTPASTPSTSNASSATSNIITQSSTTTTSKPNYANATSSTKTRNEKTDKTNQSNFTVLNRKNTSDAVTAPVQLRSDSHYRSLSTSSGELNINDDMDVSSSKSRERSPGSASVRKKTKKNGQPRNS